MKLLQIVIVASLVMNFVPVSAQEHTGNYGYHSGDSPSHVSDDYDDSDDSSNIPTYNYSPSYNSLPSAPAPINNQWAPFGMVRSQYDQTTSYPSYSVPVAPLFQPWSQSTQPVDYGRVYPGSFSYGGSSGYFNPTPSYNYYRPAPSTGYGITYQRVW